MNLTKPTFLNLFIWTTLFYIAYKVGLELWCLAYAFLNAS